MVIDLRGQVVGAAAETGVADLLHQPMQVDALATATGVSASTLRRLLRGMTHYGLCQDHGADRFALTAIGLCLRAARQDDPACEELRELLDQQRGTNMLTYSVRTSRPAFEHSFGMSFFEYMARHSIAAQRFGELMAFDTDTRATSVATTYDFSTAGQVVDVGGGYGSLIVEILKHNSHLTGVLFDIKHVLDQAGCRIDSAGLSQRCDLAAGDFFEKLPTGGDLYIYSQVLHDWNDRDCLRILETCRRALRPSAKLLLVETLMPEQIEGTCPAVELDLMMLMLTGGKERTLSEYRELLALAGFRLTEVLRIDTNFSILEASPSDDVLEEIDVDAT